MTTTTDYRAALDAAAEREGLAAELLEQMTDKPQPAARLAVERDYARTAAERGLPVKRVKYCYAKALAVKRWLEIVDAVNANRSLPCFWPYFKLPADRTRCRTERQAYGRVVNRKPVPRDPATGQYASAA